jgi:L-ascorbate metabolism protein UlaG (beta-lactamase superfamily)
MALSLTWHGHATWQIQSGSHALIVDPFFDDNPSSTIKADQVDCQFLLLTHGHFDHIADAAAIAKRTAAQVIANYEIASWLGAQGVPNTFGMNLGGAASFPFGSVKLTPAWHSSTLPDGSNGGSPAGIVLTLSGKKIYIAGDTALFSDMSLIGNLGIDIAILPIGDVFTMGIEDSIEAVKLLKPKFVLPSHYNTWPPIAQDPNAWAELVRKSTLAKPVVLKPSESFSFE